MPDTDPPVHPRKLEIVAAAITCFLEQGYHQTGVRDIARQAGVSLGNLYNHFKGKESVLVFIAELEEQELSGLIDTLSDPADPLAALDAFVTDYAAYAARPQNALLGIEILTEALRNPAIAEAFAKNRSRLVQALAGCLGAGETTGVFRAYENPAAAACLILDMIEGHGLRRLCPSAQDEAAGRTLHQIILNSLTV